jgi:hypothetical protein
MNGRPSYTIVPSSARNPPVQDEWGLFDPDQAGLGAAVKGPHAINSAKIPDASPTPGVSAAEDEVYELALPEPEPEAEPEPAVRNSADNGAVYSLEFPTRCPQCHKQISTVRVSRLLRTQVSFTSLLPRKGYVIVCPECDGMLSAELSGLL